MKSRIFRSIIAVSGVVFAACIVIIMGVLYNYFSTLQKRDLSVQLELAAAGVENSGEEYLSDFSDKSIRITWIDTDGSVIYDTQANSETAENHMDRPEVKDAFETGSGESSRYSTTLSEVLTYKAVKLKDGTVLRICIEHYTMLTLIISMLLPFIIVLIIALLLAAVMAGSASKRIVKPLLELNLDDPSDNENCYDEVLPILKRLKAQHKEIDDQLNALDRKNNEFETITRSMSEGLILLNNNKNIISINPSAQNIFCTDYSAKGKNFLEVDRSTDIFETVDKAENEGHSERIIERQGRKYQLDITKIGGDEGGIVLLVFDVTEKLNAEADRRNFTANVSHELKTPLQSIMGSAELMENGLVKPEDYPHFLGKIRSESARLVTLIDDIIRLSRLEDEEETELTRLDISKIITENIEILHDAADKKGVNIIYDKSEASILSSKRLCDEIVYNLLDNAIKYNVQNGKVYISIKTEKESAVLKVSDTGIGIPPEDISKVFERFYRVDKSRSKETGGTGLGLSIVKHAALKTGAKVSVTSEVGKGSEFTVIFPTKETVNITTDNN